MSHALYIFGGLGLFLLGMGIMTDGLRDWAGEALRRALARFTKNPVTGAMTGTVSTALIQSSSATTVMAVGFVGAGLLTFPQTLGIIFGANIGTTITGWLVALLGFKVNLKEIVLPLILVGAMMRLLGGRKIAAAGFALAGFGLIFVGIGMLQTGMEAFSDVVTPATFPSDTFLGRLLLLGLGILITLVTQSSSAGVAAAITAVHVGNISLAQGAAMVIGMDVGTTVTAAMATVGGNVNARRTGLAHVIYNLITGLGAFLVLPLYIAAWQLFAPEWDDPEIALVAFHSLFNILGVVIALPFTNRFATFITRLIRSRDDEMTGRLEPSLLPQPHVAVENALATLTDLSQVTFSMVSSLLSGQKRVSDVHVQMRNIESAVRTTRHYLNRIQRDSRDHRLIAQHSVALHVLDHLARLLSRCHKEQRLKATLSDERLAADCAKMLEPLSGDISDGDQLQSSAAQLRQIYQHLDERMQDDRRQTIHRAAVGHASTNEALAGLDAIRWLRRTCYHAWRIAHHLGGPDASDLPEESTTFEDEFDDAD